MTPLTIIFLLVSAAALLILPRNLALLPLLVGCCYMTVSQRIDIGPVTLTVIRILVAVGIIRVIIRGEKPANGLCGLDMLMVCWMAWFAISAFLRPGERIPLVFNLGQVFNIGGMYFLIRVFCGDSTELKTIIKYAAWLLAPIAVEMIMEHATGKNLFSVFGAGVMTRDDKFRATGPFAHAILAGSVGAACFPLMVAILRDYRKTALIGMVACVVIVFASNSSGPVMSLLFGIGATCLWLRREWLKYVLWAGVGCYALLAIVMERPAYYIIDSIDITGSSTGWHRARLIERSIERIGEWWLAGTDFTRHWMPTGVSWSPDHCDITNYYLLMGVWGGLPLTLLFIAMIWRGFRYVGGVVRSWGAHTERDAFMAWCLGSALFAHTATCISVAYFDQSYVFMILCLAASASLHLYAREELDEPVADGHGIRHGMDEPTSGPDGAWSPHGV